MKKQILYLFMSAALIIPTYPGSQKTEERKEILNDARITILNYQSSDSPGNIMKFYLDKLQEDGWIVVYKNKDSSSARLIGKDSSSLTINCFQDTREGITYINITYASKPTLASQEAMATNTDMPGKDIPSIPRYPGSVRKQYYKGDKVENVSYVSNQVCFNCVVEFYRAELVARGWQLFNEINSTLGEQLNIENLPEWVKEGTNEELKEEFRKSMEELKQEYKPVIEGFKKESEKLATCPFVVLIFGKKSEQAYIALTKKDNVILIDTNLISVR